MIYTHKYIDHLILFISSASEAVFASLDISAASVLLKEGGFLCESANFLVQALRIDFFVSVVFFLAEALVMFQPCL